MGHKRMEMALVRDKVARQVTFSKRKNSLFKKANELATLCAAQVAIVVFSPAGKPFSFGHPNFDFVAQRFLSQVSSSSSQPNPMRVDDPMQGEVQELNRELTDLLKQLDLEKERGEELDEALKAELAKSPYKNPATDELDQDELVHVQAAFQRLQENVKGRVSEMKTTSSSMEPVNESDN